MKNPIRITFALDDETNSLVEKMKKEMKVSQSELIEKESLLLEICEAIKIENRYGSDKFYCGRH